MVRILSLFSGIGAFEKALQRQSIEHETVHYCEIDKYASKAYSVIHNTPESENLGDITKIDTDKLSDFDLMTWGFPCQDISLAGNLKGIVEGETRSGLYFEGFRILRDKLPKYSIIENVKNLVGKRFKADFEQMLSDIESLGYNNYWQVLNAKDYGIPQNRERVFIVSIRKDVDTGFTFPPKQELKLRLKDMLEDEVEETYYLSDKLLQGFIKKEKDIVVKEATKQGYAKAQEGDSINVSQPNSKTRRGRVGKQIANTLETSCNQAVVEPKIKEGYHLRKLTPKECWRLMGFSDADFHKARDAGISNTQLYKQAGNSIVVNVLEGIFGNLLRR